jgi:hypothetical protein
MLTITGQKTQLKNVKSLVLYVGLKVLLSIAGQWELTSKLMPLERHVTFQGSQCGSIKLVSYFFFKST